MSLFTTLPWSANGKSHWSVASNSSQSRIILAFGAASGIEIPLFLSNLANKMTFVSVNLCCRVVWLKKLMN